MKNRLIDADELLARMREKYMANGLEYPGEPFWICELENAINDMPAIEPSAPDAVSCTHGEGVTVIFDGEHELSPHAYTLAQKLRNVTVEILECKTCGDVSVGWYRQDNTEEVTDYD